MADQLERLRVVEEEIIDPSKSSFSKAACSAKGRYRFLLILNHILSFFRDTDSLHLGEFATESVRDCQPSNPPSAIVNAVANSSTRFAISVPQG